MDLIYINEFVTLVEVGNYQRASEQLFITQSSLSKHIKALERDLGYELLVRKYHRLELTEEGKDFLSYAQKFADEYRRMLLESTRPLVNQKKKVVIACSYTQAIRTLPHLAVRFQREFPDCAMNVLQIEAYETENVLRNGFANIALIVSDEEPIGVHGFKTERLNACARMKVFLPSSHRLASNSTVKLSQLVNESFVTLSRESFSTVMRQKILKKEGLEFNITHSVKRKDTALSFVKNEFSIFLGLENFHTDNTDMKGIVAVQLDPDIKLYLQLIYPVGNLSGEERWLLDRIRLL